MANAILDNREELLPLVEAVKQVGQRPSIQTVRRWCHAGVKGGRKLEFVKVGHELRTSVEAVRRFFASMSSNRPATKEKTISRDEIRRRLDEHFKRMGV